jgi:hypothetical protein
VNRHIIALEEDKAIFNAVLKPLIRPLIARLSRQPVNSMIVGDVDRGDVVAEPIVKKSKFSKKV